MKQQTELTVAQKWEPVDAILARINQAKAEGKAPYQYGIDEYVDTHFNK